MHCYCLPQCLCLQAEYSAEELDALALLFTAVKVVYLGGAIGRAARLIELLEAARRASRKPLHTTLIRNEAAYFSCIAQLLREHPPPPLGPSQLRPLFLCGDSHTLSGGSLPPTYTAAAEKQLLSSHQAACCVGLSRLVHVPSRGDGLHCRDLILISYNSQCCDQAPCADATPNMWYGELCNTPSPSLRHRLVSCGCRSVCR